MSQLNVIDWGFGDVGCHLTYFSHHTPDACQLGPAKLSNYISIEGIMSGLCITEQEVHKAST